MSKKKKAFKENFSKFMVVFIVMLMLGGVLIPAVIVIFDVLLGNQ